MSQREALSEKYGEDVVANLDMLVGYCDEAAQLVAMGKARFLSDFLVQRASEAILNRIGDTVRNRLPDDLLDDYPGQPWRRIVSQRVKAAHGYHSLDYHMVWTTFAEHIPPLRGYVTGTMLGDS